jgi:hypothetical protein
MRTLHMFLNATWLFFVVAPSQGADQSDEKIPLPGLAVSLGMSVDEVALQLQHFKFQHVPEKRWQKNGHSFVQQEAITCSAVSLSALNEQLEGVAFTFERHTLVEVSLRILNVHHALQPLIESLQLVEKQHGIYHGLKGKITMCAGVGNAEKTTWTIRRNVEVMKIIERSLQNEPKPSSPD